MAFSNSDKSLDILSDSNRVKWQVGRVYVLVGVLKDDVIFYGRGHHMRNVMFRRFVTSV